MKNSIMISIGILVSIFIFLPTAHADSGQLYMVASETIDLRVAPDQDATVLGKLDNEAEVTIFEESYGWGKTFYNGKEAWVALYLLEEKSDSTDSLMAGADEKIDQQQTVEATAKADTDDEPTQIDESEALDTDLHNQEIDSKAPATATKENEENQQDQQKQHNENTLADHHFVIDPGHGGIDPGAIGSDVEEKILTLATAKEVEEQLREKGASVTLTRTDDTLITLEERVQISNSTDVHAFISLHFNAFEDPSVRGVQTFYDAGEENLNLANSIQKSLISHVKLTDRGVEQGNYQVLRDNKQPAFLIELGFISNLEEQKIVNTDEYQIKAAKGIVEGLEDYFNKDSKQ